MKKQHIAFGLFFIALLYFISPYFFERNLLLNELLAFAGMSILFYRRFRIGYDPISICMAGLISWGLFHAIWSLFRMDSLYYYFRNTVILYSMLIYFVGFYCLDQLGPFFHRIRSWLRVYLGFILFFPFIPQLFERFGLSMLFPAMVGKPKHRLVPWFIVGINFVYGITYSSLTAWMIAVFFLLIFIVPGYRVFKRIMALFFAAFTIFFIYLIPNLGLIRHRYSPYNGFGFSDVYLSSPLLRIDANSTWRLILWRQVLVDHFPANLIGIGFGTPMFKYLAIVDYSKLAMLPYILGAHNGYVYLFGRLGIPYLLFLITIYRTVFKEYFRFKDHYYATREILVFWAFFASSVLSSFNPSLESPIYAGAYWLLLGFTGRAIYNRRNPLPAARTAIELAPA